MTVRTRTATDAGRDILHNTPDGWEVDQPELWWISANGNDDPNQPGNDGTIWGNPPWNAAGPRWWPYAWAVPPAVTRCTSLIADTLAGLPWQVRRGRDRLESPAWIEDPQAKRRDGRIHSGPIPQWRRSAVEFRASSVRSMLWQGESVWYTPVRNADGTPAPPMYQLNPAFLDIDGLEYVIPGGGPVAPELAGVEGAADEYRFADDELIVIRGMIGDGLRGIGLIDAHLRDLELSGAISDYALNLLRSGVPNGYLKVSAPNLTTGKAKELQGDWMRAHGGPIKKIAVLNATTDFHDIQLTPQALELARMRDFTTVDWALIFGINPYMLGVTQSRDTYANVESRLVEFAQFSLLSWARRMESGCDAELPRGTDLKINFNALMRPNTLDRYRAHQIGLAAEFLLVDEVRDLEDLPPIPAEVEAERIAAAAAAAEARAAAANTPAPPGAPAPTDPITGIRVTGG
jgi:phage portal protein BeeE